MPIVCPTTSSALRNTSTALGCSGNLVYHCLRTEKGELTEKCLDPSWIQKYYCAEYNTAARRIDAEKCNEDLGICPLKTYLSNEVTSYSACVRLAQDYSTLTGITSTESGHDEINSPTSSVGATVILPVVIGIVIVIAAIGIGVIVYRRKRKRQSTPAIEDSILSNVGVEETVRFLKNKEEHGSLAVQDTNSKLGQYIRHFGKDLYFFGCSNYTETDAARQLRRNILSRKSTIIVGKPGSGKTSLALMTCLEFHNEKLGNRTCQLRIENDFQKITSSLEDLEENTESEFVSLVLMDGILESCLYIQEDADEMREKIVSLQSFANRNCNSLFIITASGAAYEKMNATKSKGEQVDITETSKPVDGNELGDKSESTGDQNIPFEIIDLEADEYTMSYKTIIDLLNVYDVGVIKTGQKAENCDVLCVKEEDFKEIQELSKNIAIGIPLAFFLLVKGNVSYKMTMQFLRNPIGALGEKIERMSKKGSVDEQIQYCTLVYAMLKGGQFNTDSLDKELLGKLFEFQKLKDSKNPILNTEQFMLHARDDGKHEFCHRRLLQTVFVVFGGRYPGFLIEKCEAKTLQTYIRTEKNEDTREYLAVTQVDNLKLLINRFLNDRTMRNIKEHIIWNHERVRHYHDYLTSEAKSQSTQRQSLVSRIFTIWK